MKSREKKRDRIFLIVAFFALALYLFMGFLGAVDFHIEKLHDVFVHINTVVAMGFSVIIAIMASGVSEITDAFKIAFMKKPPTGEDSLEESRLALVKAAKIIWLFAFACSAFNFIAGYRAVGDGGEPFLNATLAASYPLLYALLIANFIFMSMAAFIHKIILELKKEHVCLYCGVETKENIWLACPQCIKKREEILLQQIKKAKWWLVLLYLFIMGFCMLIDYLSK